MFVSETPVPENPMTIEVRQFLCRSDNFGALVHCTETGATAAIDAPDGEAVAREVEASGWGLTDILVTHKHADHTDGIPLLVERYGAKVTAPKAEASAIPNVDRTVSEGDTVKVGNLVARVIETPGHTLGHIAYVFEREAPPVLFAADTLFSLGCGRMIEGNPEGFWDSLSKLRDLPDETVVYCGHEYTASNARFALTIEPDNADLQERAREVERLTAEGKPTLPVTIGLEKRTNPFLRVDFPPVAEHVALSGRPAPEVFGEIRRRKDNFK
jgi:hydroxyacylglutathione hydrolase